MEQRTIAQFHQLSSLGWCCSSLGMFAAKESGGFSTILAVAQSDLLNVLTITNEPRAALI